MTAGKVKARKRIRISPPSASRRAARPAKQPAVSLTSKAYDAIKRRIITTAYAPGAYLNETAISEELGIGRTPVREAIHRLAKDGLINVIPRKGVVVRPISFDEVVQLLDVRLINEPVCAAQAARRVTRAQLEVPKKILRDAQDAIDADDGVEKLMRLDQDFHGWIAEVAGNQLLAEIILNMHDRAARFWFLSLSEGDHAQRVQEEHLAIFKAIGAKDEALAAETTRKHIESNRNTILRILM